MIIYKVFNKVNGKIYVGQTIKRLSMRIAAHKGKTPWNKGMKNGVK